MLKGLICKLKGHHWVFAYNHGIPLDSNEPLDDVVKKLDSGEYYAVHKCARCGVYDALSDGLNPYVKYGFSE